MTSRKTSTQLRKLTSSLINREKVNPPEIQFGLDKIPDPVYCCTGHSCIFQRMTRIPALLHLNLSNHIATMLSKNGYTWDQSRDAVIWFSKTTIHSAYIIAPKVPPFGRNMAVNGNYNTLITMFKSDLSHEVKNGIVRIKSPYWVCRHTRTIEQGYHNTERSRFSCKSDQGSI